MNKLWVRLSLTFTGVILVAVFIVVGASTILAELNSDDQDHFTTLFLQQPNGLAEKLTIYYQTHQSWDGVDVMLIGAQAVFFRHTGIFLANHDQQILYFLKHDKIGQPLAQIRPETVLPIRNNGQIVGYVGLASIPDDFPKERRPPAFVRTLEQALWFVATIGGIGGIVFGVVMSRSLTAPLNNLAKAAKAIGARRLSERVKEKGSAEMIAVARAFNEMAADLEQGEQLRRNLLADVAHELRTPLSVLQGNMRAILDEVYPLSQEEIVRLYEHTRLLSRLVNDLHELAQAEAKQLPLDLQETDLTKLVTGIADAFRPSAEIKEITLQTELSADLPPTQLDAARIRQVLQNLLANALRHTPADGTITIKAELESDAIRLAICDTGEGIPPEYLPHVFDRFYRTDSGRSRDRGGAGLGLAISRALVEAHGGKISVKSNGIAGEGTTFLIHLPVK